MSWLIRTSVFLILAFTGLLESPLRSAIHHDAVNLSNLRPRHLGREGSAEPFPPLREFMDSLDYGSKDAVVGIYVQSTLAMPVVQQPAGLSSFVSGQSNVATQFDLASHFGTVGLLAHNYMGGAKFFQLEHGQLIYVIFGDRSVRLYLINEILQFRALSPTSYTSQFRSLDDPGSLHSAEDLFHRIFARKDRVILQTCISNHGILNWGRLFVIAVPMREQWLPSLSFGI